MAQNFCMTINLMAFIGSKVIEVEDENGVLEEGVFVPIAKNELYKSHGRVYFGAFITEKTYNTGDNKIHYIKQRVSKEHLAKLTSLGYKCPFLGSTYKTAYTPMFQVDDSKRFGIISNDKLDAMTNKDIPF